MRENFVKVCPRCGSTNIKVDCAGGNPWDYCGDCELHKQGSILPPKGKFDHILEVKKSELENFRRQLKKTPIL
jgi:hypothetical protein